MANTRTNMLIIIVITVLITIKNCSKLSSNKTLNKKSFHTPRKLQQECPDNSYEPLNIYIDLYNFNNTFHNETLGRENKELIIESIYKAKDIIADLFQICVFPDKFVFENNSKELWFLEYWNPEMFDSPPGNHKEIEKTINNFFVFFNFSSEIKHDSSAKITLFDDNPVAGVITINEYLDNSKFNSNYLTNLMIHNFIHLLGFHIGRDDDYSDFDSIIEEEEEENGIYRYFLSKENNPTVISYAQSYFNTTTIESIDLELNEDGDIHWPSRYFLGELMTEYNYPEEQVLSGFTMAFFEDLNYIKVIKNFTGV